MARSCAGLSHPGAPWEGTMSSALDPTSEAALVDASRWLTLGAFTPSCDGVSVTRQGSGWRRPTSATTGDDEWYDELDLASMAATRR